MPVVYGVSTLAVLLRVGYICSTGIVLSLSSLWSVCWNELSDCFVLPVSDMLSYIQLGLYPCLLSGVYARFNVWSTLYF